MAAKTQDAAGETGTMCVCGHEQAKHYFGDEMHTACQAQSVSSREPCRCREYLPVQPPAASRETAIAAPTGETAEVWPVRDVLAKLADATDHLLRDHDCDTHGHEEFAAARDAARAMLAAPSAPQEPRGEPSEAMVLREYDRKLVEVWGKEEHPHAVAYGWVKSQWDAVLAATRHTQGEGA